MKAIAEVLAGGCGWRWGGCSMGSRPCRWMRADGADEGQMGGRDSIGCVGYAMPDEKQEGHGGIGMRYGVG